MKTMFIGVIIVAIIIFVVLLAVVMLNEMEKQQWVERLSTGHTECQILSASGGSINEATRCELEYIQDARQFCFNYPNHMPDACIQLEKGINADPEMNKIFP